MPSSYSLMILAMYVWEAGVGTNLYQIHTREFSRSFSYEVESGVNQFELNWATISDGITFATKPNVVVSLQHTGKYSVSNPDLLGAMVTKLYETGCFVDFSASLPHSGYYLNAHVSTI